jgi:hypothetical protein
METRRVRGCFFLVISEEEFLRMKTTCSNVLYPPFLNRLQPGARAVAPVAEWVAQALCNFAGKGPTVPTRLTQRHRSEDRGNSFVMANNPVPRRARICEVCGAEGVKNRYCRSCAVEASRENMVHAALFGHMKPKTKKAKALISKTISDHAVANTWWDPKSLPSWLTEECYVQRIQPLLRANKVREIAEAMQVS